MMMMVILRRMIDAIIKKDRLMAMMITAMLPVMSIAIIVITPTIIGLYSGSSHHNYASYNSE